MKYATDTPADLVLDSFPFPSLVEANIQIYNDWNHERTYVSYIELYKKLSNAKLFKISGSSFQGLSATNILLADLPAFCNLVCLEVSSAFCRRWYPYASFASCMRILLWFLQLSLNLESIVFTEGVLSDPEDDSWTTNSLPQYSLPNLKSVVIRNFRGCKVELDMVKLFLANAGFLQMTTITTSRYLAKDYKKQMQIASELLKFPRYSSRCALEFFTAE